MSLTENGGNDLVMPVGPMNSNGWGNGCDGWWIILFLFALMGNGGWGGFGGNNGMAMWPYFTAQNTDAGVQRGFDTAALTNQLSDIQGAIANGFAASEVADCNRAMNQMQTAYNNEIASLERSFAAQTANTAGLTNVSAQLAQCCCDNRLATAQTQALVQSENCADRQALSDGIRDIIASNTAQTQAILDKLCTLELDNYKRENDNLRTQLNMANLAASQTAQTSKILADNAAQTQALEQYLNPAPIPAYVVQNPNCCQSSTGCGF